ncbi:MAG TPA: hypothetical protein VM282_09330 [Acidimicrobiales bacterium]|nr:hypothetical protein [Acidimicrobiales bacterium]
MGRLANFLSRGAKLPGMPKARHVVERAVAPYLRDDLNATLARTVELQSQISEMRLKLERIERHQPTVLNAISTANGASRLLRRDLVETEARLMAQVDDLREQVARLAEMLEAARPTHRDA